MKTVFAAVIMTGFLLFAGGPRAYANCSFTVYNCSDFDIDVCSFKGNDWIHYIDQEGIYLEKVTSSGQEGIPPIIDFETMSCSYSDCDVWVCKEGVDSAFGTCGSAVAQNICQDIVLRPNSPLLEGNFCDSPNPNALTIILTIPLGE